MTDYKPDDKLDAVTLLKLIVASSFTPLIVKNEGRKEGILLHPNPMPGGSWA